MSSPFSIETLAEASDFPGSLPPRTASEDFASKATFASVQLDNLILGRSESLSKVAELAVALERVTDLLEPSSPSSLLDPTTAVVMNRAISAWSEAPLKTLNDLFSQAREIAIRLRNAAANSATVSPDELRSLRTFCVKLAMASECTAVPFYDRKPTRSK